MKILHFIGGFLNGGIETLLTNVVNNQVQAGNIVAIMILSNKWSDDMINALDSRVKIYYINKPIGSKNLFYWFRLLFYYKVFKADVLHLHYPGSEKLFKFKNSKEKRIVTIHNETISMPFSPTVDQYIAISKCVYDAFKINTGHDNCVVCYNGIDVDKFKCKVNYLNKPYKMVSIGRILFDVKAQDLIVLAFSKLPYEILNNIHLDILGDGKDIENLRNLIKQLSLEKYVNVKGNVTNAYVAENLSNYDLLICASHHEGLGITAIEGMVAGVPLLLSDALGYMEVTDNGKNGRHFKHSNLDALRIGIEDAYKNYKSICEIAEKSKDYARRKFSLENYIQQIDRIYKS